MYLLINFEPWDLYLCESNFFTISFTCGAAPLVTFFLLFSLPRRLRSSGGGLPSHWTPQRRRASVPRELPACPSLPLLYLSLNPAPALTIATLPPFSAAAAIVSCQSSRCRHFSPIDHLGLIQPLTQLLLHPSRLPSHYTSPAFAHSSAVTVAHGRQPLLPMAPLPQPPSRREKVRKRQPTSR